MIYIDILSWGIGAVIYYYLRETKLFKINQGID